MQAWEASNNLAYGQGSFVAAALEHARQAVYFYTDPFMLWGALGFYVQIATTMLIGFLVGRNGWVRRIPELMPWVKRVQWWAFGVGGACTLIFGILGQLDQPPAPSLAKVVVSVAYVAQPSGDGDLLCPDHRAGRAGAVSGRGVLARWPPPAACRSPTI